MKLLLTILGRILIVFEALISAILFIASYALHAFLPLITSVATLLCLFTVNGFCQDWQQFYSNNLKILIENYLQNFSVLNDLVRASINKYKSAWKAAVLVSMDFINQLKDFDK